MSNQRIRLTKSSAIENYFTSIRNSLQFNTKKVGAFQNIELIELLTINKDPKLSNKTRARVDLFYSCFYLGWDGGIRTPEWRNQNPLPYHLATSHR